MWAFVSLFHYDWQISPSHIYIMYIHLVPVCFKLPYFPFYSIVQRHSIYEIKSERSLCGDGGGGSGCFCVCVA